MVYRKSPVCASLPVPVRWTGHASPKRGCPAHVFQGCKGTNPRSLRPGERTAMLAVHATRCWAEEEPRETLLEFRHRPETRFRRLRIHTELLVLHWPAQGTK